VDAVPFAVAPLLVLKLREPTRGRGGVAGVADPPREKEAGFRLAASVWSEMMERHYPNTTRLCLRRDVFDRLYPYKTRRGLPTWEQALEAILPPAHEGGAS
jgi:hypothetical protein